MAVYANENGTIQTLASEATNILMFNFSQRLTQTANRVDVATYNVTPKAILIAPEFYGNSANLAEYTWNPIKLTIGNSASVSIDYPSDTPGSGSAGQSTLSSASISVQNGKITVSGTFKSTVSTATHTLSGAVLIFY